MVTGVSTATAAHAFKQGFFTAAKELWEPEHPELLVVWGALVGTVPDNYFLVLGTESEQQPATMSTNRSREETLRLEVQLFVQRWGEVDAAREADEYMYARLGELERHVRMTDTTLGGVVRHCFLVNHVTDAVSFEGTNSQGHVAAAAAVFEAKVRVTG